MDSLRPTIDAIWQVLDMPPPLGDIGRSYSFDLSDMPVDLQLEANGSTVTVRGLMGYLKTPQYDAQDKLKRLLRFGTGLMGINDAALEVPEIDRLNGDEDGVSVAVYAVAKATLKTPATSIDALRQVIEWRGYCEPVLDQAGDDTGGTILRPRDDESADIDSQMVIFQP